MPPSSQVGMGITSGPQGGLDATGPGSACLCLAERGGGETQGEPALPDVFTAALYTPLRVCLTQKPRRVPALGHPRPGEPGLGS